MTTHSPDLPGVHVVPSARIALLSGTLHEFYGGSEGGGSTEWLERPGSVDRIISGIAIRTLDEDGYLFLQDRRTDVIIIGEVNLYPAAVESVLQAHPLVHDVCVVGLPDDEWGQRVTAVVQLVDGAAPVAETKDETVALTRAELAGAQIPREFMPRPARSTKPSPSRVSPKSSERAAARSNLVSQGPPTWCARSSRCAGVRQLRVSFCSSRRPS